MPVPQQRDLELTRARLGDWLRGRAPAGTDVVVHGVEVPRQGFSTETLLVDVDRTGPAGTRREVLVVRVAPTRHRLYPWSRFAEQYQVITALHEHTDVPVPAPRGFEPDPDLLGAPFAVMDHVAGRVPADLPSYHAAGWVTELTPAGRARLWYAGVDILRRIHRLDPAALGLDGLDQPAYGPTPLVQQLNCYAEHLDFFGCADAPVPLAALEWLRGHQPPESGPPRLLWGDARLGNIIFAGVRPAAVLDWEMVGLGPPEIDLAWYLYLDRHLSEGIGATRLPGLPERAETVARYEELICRPVRHLEYHEVFAGFRFCLITARLVRLAADSGMLPRGTDFPLHRNATRLLARTIGLLPRR